MSLLYLNCSSAPGERAILGALLNCGVDCAHLEARLGPGSRVSRLLHPGSPERAALAGSSAGVSLANQIISLGDFESLIHGLELAHAPLRFLTDTVARLKDAGFAADTLPNPGSQGGQLGPGFACLAAIACALDSLGIDRVEASPFGLPLRTGAPLDPGIARLAEGLIITAGMNDASVAPGALAFLAAAVSRFGSLPPMRLRAAGTGVDPGPGQAGGWVQAFVGELAAVPEADRVSILETNIDDMPAQGLDHVMGLLFAAGALDVYFTPIQMKKNRPAVQISVLASDEKTETCARVLLRETTTLGLRIVAAQRRVLERRELTVQTPYGAVPVKAAVLDGQIRSVKPEYSVCHQLAVEKNIPLQRVEEHAAAAAWETLRAEGWSAVGERGSSSRTTRDPGEPAA
jgi:pyridinium-3,5-bisthiocarboxylic acid mononucleotide nickel chelatase